jgi:hypothetical protein
VAGDAPKKGRQKKDYVILGLVMFVVVVSVVALVVMAILSGGGGQTP